MKLAKRRIEIERKVEERRDRREESILEMIQRTKEIGSIGRRVGAKIPVVQQRHPLTDVPANYKVGLNQKAMVDPT